MGQRLLYKTLKESKEDKETQPKRPLCPFYGFGMIVNYDCMKDTRGNQCALIIKSYDPCQMEKAGNTPSWHKCPLNTNEKRRIIEGSLEKISVFPDEFWPATSSGWEGISLKIWMGHIMDGIPIEK